MTQMKCLSVLQVLPELITGGVERGTIDIARALIEQGHQAIVVSNGGPLTNTLRDMGAQHISLPVHSKNPFVIRRNAKRIEALIRALNIDIVHARSRAPAWSCYWACNATNIPFVTTFHGTYGHGSALKRWYNQVMCRGDRVIAVSEFIAHHIRSVYSQPPASLKVIHRGIDTDLFSPENVALEQVNALRKTWQIPDSKKIVLLPGRLTRWKGQVEFLQAISELNRNDYFCLIVGSDQGRTDYTEELGSMIESLGLGAKVKLVGHHDDMTTVYALSDIVVSASREPEAFGRVTCEAQAMEKLVVANMHGGVQETIDPQQRDWQCQPSDATTMTKAIDKALNFSLEEAALIGRYSRAHIIERFSLESMTSQTINLYQELAK